MKQMKTGIKRRGDGPVGRKTPLAAAAFAGVVSVAVGTGVGLGVLALVSFIAVKFTVPLTLIRPLGCMALCAASLSAAFVFGTIQRKNYLFFGICSGIFYAGCLAIAAAICGGTAAVQSNLGLLGALVLAGAAGGLINALRLPAGR